MRKPLSAGQEFLAGVFGEPLKSHPSDLPRVFELQFLFDVGAMGLNRFRAHVQRLRNFPDVATLADQLEDLQFAIGQELDQVMTGARMFVDAVLLKLGGNTWTEITF